jgi:hypothetical protein
MANYLALVNGVPRQSVLPGTTAIYDQSITIVASGGTPPSTVNGPVSSGTALTLPASGVYTVLSAVPNMNIYLNGDRLEYLLDWNTSGAGPNFTAFTLTFGLVAGDRLDLRTERSS